MHLRIRAPLTQQALFLSGSPPGILPAGADAANASLAMSTPPAAHAAANVAPPSNSRLFISMCLVLQKRFSLPDCRPTQNGRQRFRRSEEHTSELQSLMRISYAVFCLKKKKTTLKHKTRNMYKHKQQ